MTSGNATNKSRRIHILNECDMATLYERPCFTTVEQNHFFNIPLELLFKLKIKDNTQRRLPGLVYFVLQHGYFKAKHLFCVFQFSSVLSDVKFIMGKYFEHNMAPTKLPCRRIQQEMKALILSTLNFKRFNNNVHNKLQQHLATITRKTLKPVEIFDATVKYLSELNCTLPEYSTMQDIIGASINDEEKRLVSAINSSLNKDIKHSLEKLLTKDNKKYLITTLQCDAKSFQHNEMKKEILKLNICKPIYLFGKKFLSKTGLSKIMIEHYAELVHLYQSDRLRKLQRGLAYVYMICYVQLRYEKLTNNLVQGFIYHVDKYHNEAKKHAKASLAENISSIGPYELQLGNLIKVFIDKDLMMLRGKDIKKHAFSIMPENDIAAISDALTKNSSSKKQKEQNLIWQYHKEHPHSVALNLRQIFSSLSFDANDKLDALFKAITFWKEQLSKDKKLSSCTPSRVPAEHIKPLALRKKFNETVSYKGRKKKVINASQYEFYLYWSIREKLKQRKVTVNSSVDYKSLNAEINKPGNWEGNQNQLLKELGNKQLIKPIDDILNDLENILEPMIHEANKRIINKENTQIKIKKHKDGTVSWTLPYSKKNKEIDNPFYNQLDPKAISEIFDFAENEYHFMTAFNNIKTHNTSSKQDYLAIKAAILANGTMQGINVFSKRSNLKYKRLKTAEDNHLCLYNLRKATDIIISKMIDMAIFDLYFLNEKLHGSVDGKKKATRRKLLKARFSSKYFGTDVGLVIMTMNAGHVPFATQIIGANEHESHYVYPMLFQNNHIVDPHIISTDTAGTNNLNDLLYFLIGKTHAPCYRSIADRASKICGFKPLSNYKDYLIQPITRVNTKLIRSQWDNILPILYSLLSHESKQENIIRQLSSHDNKSEVKNAIWELSNILNSIHLLKYIDDQKYQSDIRTSLNRGEAYHQLLDKIAEVGHGGDFRGISELEVEIWNECLRFIAILIISYNMNLLNKLYEEHKDNPDAIAYLSSISPVASQHLNIGGLYEFSEERANIDVDNVVAAMGKILRDILHKASLETNRKAA